MNKSKKFMNVIANQGGVSYEVPAYANAGGSGDRESSITVDVDEHATTFWRSFGTSGTLRQDTVDGNIGVTIDYVNNALAVANRWIEFDFVTKRLITEVKFYVNTAFADCGVWKWQGYNGSTWVDVGGSFTLGVTGVSSLIETITTMSANTTAYTKYRMIGVSGNSTFNMYYWTEFEFKIGNQI